MEDWESQTAVLETGKVKRKENSEEQHAEQHTDRVSQAAQGALLS